MKWRPGAFVVPPRPYGTVPYFQYNARWWHRHSWSWVLIALFQAFVLFLPQLFWPIGLLNVAMIFWAGTRWQDCRDRMRSFQQQAWAAETEGVMEGMAGSGEFELIEAIEALRDGPAAPGIKAKDWVQMHDDLIDKIKRGEVGP